MRVLAIRPSRATATNLALINSTTSAVQIEGARPPLAAAQHEPTGAPPEPLQTRIGLPSAAACLRASQMLKNHGISWKRVSPGCGLIILWSLSNCSGGIGFGSSATADPPSPPATKKVQAPKPECER